MPVVEYMFQLQGSKKHIPDFIKARGHWYNPTDHTFVGWVEENPDYYIPESIVRLSKQDLVQRVLAMHAENPQQKFSGNDGMERKPMTNQEVQEMVETWYDNFVSENENK
jgi:hypothetical protein